MAVDINTSKTNVENVSVWMRAISGKEMHDRDLAFQHETHALMIAARHADAAERQANALESIGITLEMLLTHTLRNG